MPKIEKLPDSIINSACDWVTAETNARHINCRPLTHTEISIAKKVGVLAPHKIRLVEQDSMPFPDKPALLELCNKYGFPGENAIGLTLDYTVYIRNGHLSTRLLSHEFRHVKQYENAGSVRNFLIQYIGQIISVGYIDAPFEIDARQHEFDTLM